MLALYGVSNSSIVTFMRGLRPAVMEAVADDEVTKFKPTLLAFEDGEDVVSALRGIILVPTVALFSRWRELLKDRPVVVVIFDTAILLEYVSGLKALDVAEKMQSHTYTFKPIDYAAFFSEVLHAKKRKSHVEVGAKTMDLIPRMLGSTKASILSPILTYTYTLKDIGQRHKAQVALFEWLRNGEPGSMPRLPESTESKRLFTFLSGESATKLVGAVRAVVGGKSVDAAAKKFDVSAFDIRYVRAQFGKLGIT